MDVVILTRNRSGSASFHLRHLLKNKNFDRIFVIYDRGIKSGKKKFFKRKIKKIANIGILGAINGIRIRKWFDLNKALNLKLEPIDSICKTHNIDFFCTDSINNKETVNFLKKIDADLGISIGNGYISQRVFKIPKFGMINIHHEVLPDYQGAQSIIWQIFNNSKTTGFTIHFIDKSIDTGKILMKKIVPIKIEKSLKMTVSKNYFRLWENSAEGLDVVISNFNYYMRNSKPQGEGRVYTTPSFRQFMKIRKNHRKMIKEIKNNSFL